ncbi:hypothetical protein [Burkholderia metallica]|uniref:hypothetical protein n=1 Tax=Burkholderia metallica TaxID=488729 RepID=UPI00157B0F04|nr:hypothetical protein [Burkholderia metallica]
MLQDETVVSILEAMPGSRGEQTADHAAAIAGDEPVANYARRSSAMSEASREAANVSS